MPFFPPKSPFFFFLRTATHPFSLPYAIPRLRSLFPLLEFSAKYFSVLFPPRPLRPRPNGFFRIKCFPFSPPSFRFSPLPLSVFQILMSCIRISFRLVSTYRSPFFPCSPFGHSPSHCVSQFLRSSPFFFRGASSPAMFCDSPVEVFPPSGETPSVHSIGPDCSPNFQGGEGLRLDRVPFFFPPRVSIFRRSRRF